MRKSHVDETTRPDQFTDALISKGLIRANGGVSCPKTCLGAPHVRVRTAPPPPRRRHAVTPTRSRQRLSRPLFIAPVMLRSPEDAIQWRAKRNGDIERTDDGGQSCRVQLTVPERVIAGAATLVAVEAADGRQFRTVDPGTEWMLLR